MWSRKYGIKIELLFVVQNRILLCLFSKIKYAMFNCVLDFFYSLKEKHCRSPPPINLKFELIGGKKSAIRTR